MSNSVITTPPRDRFAAQRCLLLASIATFVLCLPGAADARNKGRQTDGGVPAVTEPVKTVAASTITASSVTPASLRAANDLATARAMVETPTGAIRSKATVAKASAAMTPAATTVGAVVDSLPAASPQRPRDWYPESHSYLRPYHYKWRYWTPG